MEISGRDSAVTSWTTNKSTLTRGGRQVARLHTAAVPTDVAAVSVNTLVALAEEINATLVYTHHYGWDYGKSNDEFKKLSHVVLDIAKDGVSVAVSFSVTVNETDNILGDRAFVFLFCSLGRGCCTNADVTSTMLHFVVRLSAAYSTASPSVGICSYGAGGRCSIGIRSTFYTPRHGRVHRNDNTVRTKDAAADNEVLHEVRPSAQSPNSCCLPNDHVRVQVDRCTQTFDDINCSSPIDSTINRRIIEQQYAHVRCGCPLPASFEAARSTPRTESPLRRRRSLAASPRCSCVNLTTNISLMGLAPHHLLVEVRVTAMALTVPCSDMRSAWCCSSSLSDTSTPTACQRQTSLCILFVSHSL